MNKIFILCLARHNKWGYLLIPYVSEIIEGEDYIIPCDRITKSNLDKYSGSITDAQRKMVQYIEQYSDSEMARVMKRKTNTRDFIQSVSDDDISKTIRPYIERRLFHCFELLPGSNTRLFLRDESDRIYFENEIIQDQLPAEAIFNFHYDPEGGLRYFLSVFSNRKEIKLTGKKPIILVNQPSMMVLDHHLLRFKDIDSKKLEPFTKKEYISIPRNVEEKYFNSFVIDSICRFRTNTEGLLVEDEQSEPTAVVSLEKDLNLRPALVLRFDYGNGRVFDASQLFEIKASVEKQTGQYLIRRFARNRKQEDKYIAFLRQQGFHDAGNSLFYSRAIPDKDSGKDTTDLIEMLNDLSDILIGNGFRIEQRMSQKYYTGSYRLKVEMSDNRDWFDVHSTVHFNGFEIPFIAFGNHIIRQDRNYTLPNGEILVLPAEWMSKYQQVMLMAETDSGTLRINKRYFTVIGDTFQGIDDKYRDDMLNLCDVQTAETDENISVNATLRPYQLQGVKWMNILREHHFGGCLADDMGLGKTLQTLSLLQLVTDEYRKNRPAGHDPDMIRVKGEQASRYVQLSLFDTLVYPPCQTDHISQIPSLIVMPSSLIHNWINEAKRFTPTLKVLQYTGANRQNNTRFDHYHIVLTTYGILRNDLEILQKQDFLYLILDEAQYVKNPDSVTYKSVLQINASYYLSLSGTPVENSLTDLWAQMNFLNRGLLGDLNFFREHFATPIEKLDDDATRLKLQRLVQPFLLRRTKQEVTPELPELMEQVCYCEMTEQQRILYEEEKSKARNEIIESIGEQGVNKSSILIFRALNRLRQLAIHPAMLNPDNDDPGSGKFEQITEMLDKLYRNNHKTLLFSSFTKHLDLVAGHLQQKGLSFVKLTGQTRNREEVISQFNDSNIPFFLISLKAGGVGLNLTSADYVLLLDPWWNPAAEQQAISRAHRIGQSNKVFAYRMVTLGTIEEKILQLQEKKSALAAIFSQSDNPFRQMTTENVMELFE